MSRYLDGESADTIAERRRFSWRGNFQWPAFTCRIIDTLRLWAQRWREREELRNYLVMDYRAGTDLGIEAARLRDWAERPFWRE